MTRLLPGVPSLYLYSADDPLCDVAKLESLLAARKQAGADVRSVRWETSQHVGHLRSHPQEYSEALLQFLERAR